MSDWRRFSSISVVSSTKNSVNLVCNTAELHATLVGEIEAWCDHEVELRAQLLRMAFPNQGAQDSWFAVTAYYWAAFSATLFLRLLGRPVFRMSANDLDTLRKLSPGATLPTEGTFKLVQGADLSATTRGITLQRLKSNYHQSLWTGLITEIADIDRATRGSNPNAIEGSLISEVLRVMCNRHGILSDIRNLVNYRAEIAFPASRNGLGFSVLPSVATCRELDSLGLLARLRSAANAVETKEISRFNSANGNFLFWMAVTLSVLSNSLYNEVSGAFAFDRTWAKRRYQFAASDTCGIPAELRMWPPFP